MSCDHFDLENLKKQLIKRVQKNACPDLKFSLLKCSLDSLEGMKGERARVTTLNENAIFLKQKGKCIHYNMKPIFSRLLVPLKYSIRSK